MTIAAIAVAAMYAAYARRHFPECRTVRTSDRGILRDMLAFCGWDVYGNLCYTSRVQGTIVVLNRFGGTALNAAGGLTLTVGATVTAFASTVVSAFRPQIIKEYAAGAYGRTLSLLNNAARYSILLMGLLIVPAIVEMDTLLGIWLVNVPPYTAAFCRLCLMAACGELLNTVLAIGIHATGRVFRISFISGTLYLLELPAMWLLLRHTGRPAAVYALHLAAVFAILIVNTFILRHQMRQFSPARFLWRGVLQPGIMICVSYAAAHAVACAVPGTWLRLATSLAASSATLCALTWLFILPADAKTSITDRLRTWVK